MLVRCPAKVNTFLSVGPPDQHGYHPIRTVLQAVGLYDELAVEVSNQDHLACDWTDLPSENTVTKALRLLREMIDVPPLQIEIKKSIPAQAGLGGGSSDAAGLIRAVKRLCPDYVTDQFAFEVASAVGKDVPFFLVGGRAKATGYGDQLEPLPDVTQEWLLIVKPDVGVATKEAYAALDQSDRDWRDFSDEPYNDFERVAPCVCGDIAERLQVHGASRALLCGSGSAVYGSFHTEERARRAHEALAAERLGLAWVAPTLTREASLWMS